MNINIKEHPKQLLFIGGVVPDEPQYRTDALSRAGNLAQLGLIKGLIDVGEAPDLIISLKPIPVYPKSRSIIVKRDQVNIEGINAILVGYVNIPIIKYAIISLSIIKELLHFIKRGNLNVISYNFSVFYILPLLILKYYKSRVIPILFDVVIPGSTVKDSILRKIDFSVTKSLIRLMSGVIVITETIAIDFLRDTPYLVLEGGLGKVQLKHYSKTREKTSSSDFNIVFSGALELHNGIDVIIDALNLIDNPSVKLHIAGSGSLEDFVKREAIFNNSIKYYGYLDPQEIENLYNTASLLINHRSYERIDTRYLFPSKLIEYLATGIPVISTRFSSLPKDYHPFLFLVADESPRSLSDAIKEIIKNYDSAITKAKSAQDYMLKNKSWTTQAERIINFIKTID